MQLFTLAHHLKDLLGGLMDITSRLQLILFSCLLFLNVQSLTDQFSENLKSFLDNVSVRY